MTHYNAQATHPEEEVHRRSRLRAGISGTFALGKAAGKPLALTYAIGKPLAKGTVQTAVAISKVKQICS